MSAAPAQPARMDPEVKARWVAALRSGEYKQGCGQLRGCDDDFCCLGVLCDLYAKEAGLEWSNDLMWDREDALPCAEVCIWAGLPHEDPFAGKVRLSAWNDGAPHLNTKAHTFLQIADLIEKHL